MYMTENDIKRYMSDAGYKINRNMNSPVESINGGVRMAITRRIHTIYDLGIVGGTNIAFLSLTLSSSDFLVRMSYW